jgi:hypothetical protein
MTVPKPKNLGLANKAKEPLNKSRTVATEAWRDGMREARRSEWLIPLREPRDNADRPPTDRRALKHRRRGVRARHDVVHHVS